MRNTSSSIHYETCICNIRKLSNSSFIVTKIFCQTMKEFAKMTLGYIFFSNFFISRGEIHRYIILSYQFFPKSCQLSPLNILWNSIQDKHSSFHVNNRVSGFIVHESRVLKLFLMLIFYFFFLSVKSRLIFEWAW